MDIGTFPLGGTWVWMFPPGIGGSSGGGGIDVYDEGVLVLAGATALDITGSGLTATDQGGGIAEIAGSGGGSASLHPIVAVLVFGN